MGYNLSTEINYVVYVLVRNNIPYLYNVWRKDKMRAEVICELRVILEYVDFE